MQRFRVKQWREIFEEVIVEAVDLAEAEQLADLYPDDMRRILSRWSKRLSQR